MAGKILVRLPLRHAQQIIEELFLGVRSSERFRWRVMGAAHISGMACVPASVEFRGSLNHQNGSPVLACADGRAQRGVSAARNEDVKSAGRPEYHRLSIKP
jgi:hypothetical protein